MYVCLSLCFLSYPTLFQSNSLSCCDMWMFEQSRFVSFSPCPTPENGRMHEIECLQLPIPINDIVHTWKLKVGFIRFIKRCWEVTGVMGGENSDQKLSVLTICNSQIFGSANITITPYQLCYKLVRERSQGPLLLGLVRNPMECYNS